MTKDPFNPVDTEARALARSLIENARHGALGVLDTGEPVVTRVALAPEETSVLILISDLAPHTAALRARPKASLLIGEPGKGDPLAHPRITLQVEATFLEKTENLAKRYLAHQPKAQLYIGFAAFHRVRLSILSGLLNGGFGKAYKLGASDFSIST
ncbi:MAG: pyridoxamine 5'-phosphate oxidase family protein [Boseongicola sp.]|nr:pyridoxamine 5'-phosphate oxidase family protein [Boseongicola sp.]